MKLTTVDTVSLNFLKLLKDFQNERLYFKGNVIQCVRINIRLQGKNWKLLV